MTYWFKVTKTSVTCPFCGNKYHFVDKTIALLIKELGCGCKESEEHVCAKRGE